MIHIVSKRSVAYLAKYGTLEPMTRPVPDARVLKTYQRLADALVALTLEQGFDALTVRELTDRAEVGYATFFRHFSSKEALLGAVFESTLGELLAQLGPVAAPLDPLEVGTRVFRHARDHADRYRALLRTSETLNLQERCLRVSLETLSATVTAKRSVVPFEVAAHHLVYSFIGLLTWYLDADLPYSPERMGEILEQLILGPTYKVAFEPK